MHPSALDRRVRRLRPTRLIGGALAALIGITTVLVGSSSDASPVASEALSAASATGRAVRNDLPAEPQRPEVYLAYFGSEGLLGNTDSLWPFVRANLDGLWGNPFNLAFGAAPSQARAIELTRKVSTRQLIVEHPITAGTNCQGLSNDSYWTDIEAQAPDIDFVRVAAAVYAGQNPNCWGVVGGINAVLSHYQRQGYGTVYTLFQPQNLSPTVNAGVFPTIASGSSGDLAYRTSGGNVVECPLDSCTDPTFGAPFIQALRDAHARGVPFVWFTGYSRAYGIGSSGWLARVQATYNVLSFFDLWRAGDKVVIINYDGYPALPERNANGTPADTVTGILAWLLEQRPIETLCTSPC